MAEKKTEIRITIRSEDKAEIIAAARLVGMTLAGYMRHAAIKLARGM